MIKAEIISQLKSLRDSTIDYMKGNDDLIFKKDVEALDATIDFLNQADHKVSPNDVLVPDCVPIIRCKDCKFSREGHLENAQEKRFVEGCIWCTNWAYVVMPEDYCSNAKRKKT